MAKKRKDLVLSVGFSNVTVGDESAKVNVGVWRRDLDIEVADSTFCHRRITARLEAKPNAKDPDQPALPGMDETITLEGVFDVKSINVTRDKITAGLTSQLADLDLANFIKFAKREGRLTITEIIDLPEEES